MCVCVLFHFFLAILVSVQTHLNKIIRINVKDEPKTGFDIIECSLFKGFLFFLLTIMG